MQPGFTLSDPPNAPSSRRVRIVRLHRCGSHPLGFSIRGGREHGTGVFVSHVENGAHAHKQGLKAGDQILRVNGFPVDGAIHQEVLSLLRAKNHLVLKVRSVGMIPVKDHCNSPLTWRLISSPVIPTPSPSPPHPIPSHPPLEPRLSTSSSVQTGSCTDGEPPVHVSINMSAAGQGLGCCICKGPSEKPGIFIQSTKGEGMAREAGLRPGDQIITCNGISFEDIDFTQAVVHLKSSRCLDLMIRKGVGADLFPGESSGYNSSASSVTEEGDVIDTTIDNNHRSLVNVVSLDRAAEWEDIEQEWRKAQEVEDGRNKDNNHIKRNEEYLEPRVVIEVKGGDNIPKTETKDILEEERRRLREEQQRLKEEAQRLEEERRKFEDEKRRTLSKTPSLSSGASGASLASALSKEIQRRQQRNPNDDEVSSTAEDKRRTLLKGVPAELVKREQHDQLLEEFRRAHRRMFSGGGGPTNNSSANPRVPTNRERQAEAEENKYDTVANQPNLIKKEAKGVPVPPPPPPPPIMSTTNGSVHDNHRPASPAPDYHATDNVQRHDFHSNSHHQQLTTSTTVNRNNPVVVSIGTYPSNLHRPDPSRLDFLPANSNGVSGDVTPENRRRQLQTELAQTLSRANLRQRNGTTDVPEPPRMNGNSVTVIVNGNPHNPPAPPMTNGILKNTSSNYNGASKTISFGGTYKV